KNSSKTIVSIKKGLFSSSITLNSIFLNANKTIIADIITFLRDHKKNNYSVKEAKRNIKKFYEDNKVDPPQRKTNIRIDYKHKNISFFLKEIIEELSIKYDKIDFNDLKITWGKNSGNRLRSIRFGSYCNERRLIRLHPILDNEKIPDYFVKSVIYHEVGHFIHKNLNSKSKTHHNKEFYAILKEIDPNFFLSDKWEKANSALFFSPDNAFVNKFFFSV
ncbi:MAG TPA: DUF45 domain-containing protein, partial [Spirochaetota bacterium]|nr:DUF45 domain-containing protein [Spirochaetota bacterium]